VVGIVSKIALGKISDIQAGPFGTQLHKSEYVAVGVPMLNAKNIGHGVVLTDSLDFVSDSTCKRLNRYILKKGDIIFGRAGSIDRHTYINDSFAGYFQGTNAIRVRCHNLSISEYISYYLWLPAIIKQISDTAGKTTIKYLDSNLLREIVVNLPDEKNAQIIVEILSTLDRKIALNNAINAELEKTAKLLYDYWFTQFDFPNTEGKPYKSSGGAMVWNEQLKREIPNDWSVTTLLSYIREGKGGDWGKEEAVGNCTKKVYCIRGADYPFLSAGGTSYPPIRYILPKNKDKILTYGDLIIEISGGSPTQSTGRICYINDDVLNRFDTDIITSNFCRAISLNDQSDLYLFYLHWKRLYEYGILFNYESKTTGIKNLLLDDVLSSQNIIVFPEKLKAEFNKFVSPIYSEIQKKCLESTQIVALRDFLLPLLMNGQVAVATTDTATTETVVDIPLSKEKQDKRVAIFKRLVLSAYILDNICEEPTAGRVKFEKLLYLSEHCAELPLHSEFRRAAAGPYDSQALFGIESQLQKNKWFKRQKIKDESRAYIRMEKADGYKSYVDKNLDAQQKNVIDKLIRLFKSVRTEQCEIVATLYGAWNDFIIGGAQPTDEQIVDEVLTNWNESKKKITCGRWLAALRWMRDNGIIPTGYGISTKAGGG
jgi:type I restriction enzyme S subunit